MSEDDGIAQAEAKLRAKLQVHEDGVRKTKMAINALYEAYDKPAPFAEAEHASNTIQARTDQFYGQPLATAVRWILENRKLMNRGAATVNEIYDALKAGGFAFDAKDDENAKRGLRISLTKNNVTFHKTPTGAYGLLEWYPNAKPVKDEDDEKDAAAAPKRVKTIGVGPKGNAAELTPDDFEEGGGG